MSDKRLEPGTPVKIWVGLELMGYPKTGTIRRWIEGYPGGGAYEVAFPPNDLVPVAVLKPEWVFLDRSPAAEKA